MISIMSESSEAVYNGMRRVSVIVSRKIEEGNRTNIATYAVVFSSKSLSGVKCSTPYAVGAPTADRVLL